MLPSTHIEESSRAYSFRYKESGGPRLLEVTIEDKIRRVRARKEEKRCIGRTHVPLRSTNSLSNGSLFFNCCDVLYFD